MNKKKKARMIVIQLLILLAVAIGLVLWISSEKKEVTIWEYARTIDFDNQNYRIQEGDIVQATIMQADVKPEYVLNKDEIVGKYLVGDAFKSTPVVQSQLSSDPPVKDSQVFDAEASYRRITIPITYATSFAGDIESGDRVDLVFISSGSGKSSDKTSNLQNVQDGSATSIRYTTAKIFMQDISVYQVYTAAGEVYVKRNTDPLTLNSYNGELSTDGTTQNPQNYTAPAYAVLSVTSEQYEEIISRMNMGRVELVGRFDGSQDASTNGYIVAQNGTAEIFTGEGTLESPAEMFDPNSVAVEEVNTNRSGIYTYIKDLAKIQMTDEQRERYASIYTRYTSIMTTLYGSGWESDSPDSISIVMIKEAVDPADQSMLALVEGFRADLETLAKELRGESTILPW